MSNRQSDAVLRAALCAALATVVLAAPGAELRAQGLEWVRQVAGSDGATVNATVMDAASNTFVAGGLGGTLTLGEGEANATTLESNAQAGALNGFVAMYGVEGDLVWASQISSASGSAATDVAIGGGVVYVAGIFEEPTTFGAGEVNEATLTPGGARDFYIAAFDQAGGLIWTRQYYLDAESTSLIANSLLSADGLGSLYVTGAVSASDGDALVFAAGQPDEILVPIAVGDLAVPYLARFDSNGALSWAATNPPRTTPGGTTAHISPGDIAIGPGGDAFIVGAFSGSVVFAPGEVNETPLTTSTSQNDVFVARYDTEGDLVWVREGDSSTGPALVHTVVGTGIAVDSAGNSYVTGTFDPGITLGPGEVNETTLTAVGSTGSFSIGDAFVAKLDSAGNLLWARQDGGSGGDWGTVVALDGSDNPFVAGYFGETATFGLGEPGETTLRVLPVADNRDIFVSSYDTNGTFQWARRAGGPLIDTPTGIAVDGNGEARVTGSFTGSILLGPGEPGETILVDDAEVGHGFLANFSAEPAIIDTDGDGTEDAMDLDDDNDGVPDAMDEFPVGRFVDARPDYWAFTFVEALARAGITGGCSTGNYCPEDTVTRAQMAVFLERGINGSEFSPPAATGSVFTDVAAEDFAASFIEQLFTDGVTGGCGNGEYCPGDSVTRAQMAVFLLRAKYGAGYLPPAASGVFGDVDPVSYWAAAWIEQLAAEGITAGCGGGDYCPEDAVTRAQMAVFLVRTFGL